MTEFYLITGFLGAGKTSFLKGFVRQLAGKSLRLIINEFGHEGVDGTLLADVNATMREISGGSIFCSCRLDRFEEALDEGLVAAPDVIIVEASGLSDPTNIRRILERNEQQGRLLYRGCICVVDAARLHKVLSTARMVRKQLMVADLLLVNKSDLATAEQLAWVGQAMAEYCPNTPCHVTTGGALLPQWLGQMNTARRPDDATDDRPDITNQRASVAVAPELTQYELERFLSSFAEDSNRIKGFVQLHECGWLVVDCVGAMVRVTAWTGVAPGATGLTVLATAGMPLRRSITAAAKWYPAMIKVRFG